ncbi:MAG: hypothetical protein WAQ53_18510 [Thiofilum sp.]|uniref:PA3496 family putative envelope integrity protein n=1 Tax=Thiofilum sp. TaxID=2212733 RepID=UPI0025D96BAC|nr:hypothetical protein [Thiofilum sp.]MBK8451966.1 hypothetical protein [Thiofilum sp.]
MRDNNNDDYIDEAEIDTDKLVNNDASKNKPHVVRRNIEDLLERQALRKRLKDIYDDDFLSD